MYSRLHRTPPRRKSRLPTIDGDMDRAANGDSLNATYQDRSAPRRSIRSRRTWRFPYAVGRIGFAKQHARDRSHLRAVHRAHPTPGSGDPDGSSAALRDWEAGSRRAKPRQSRIAAIARFSKNWSSRQNDGGRADLSCLGDNKHGATMGEEVFSAPESRRVFRAARTGLRLLWTPAQQMPIVRSLSSAGSRQVSVQGPAALNRGNGVGSPYLSPSLDMLHCNLHVSHRGPALADALSACRSCCSIGSAERRVKGRIVTR